MKEYNIQIRELTPIEQQNLGQIIVCTNNIGAHILFGMMAMDLLDQHEKEQEILYSKLIEKNNEPMGKNYSIFSLMALFDRWICEGMTYKDLGRVKELPEKTRGLESAKWSLTCVIMDCVCGVGTGFTKREKMLADVYEMLNADLIEKEGWELTDHPEMTMRYIVSVIEYLGFKRIRNQEETCTINVSEIEYEEYS